MRKPIRQEHQALESKHVHMWTHTGTQMCMCVQEHANMHVYRSTCTLAFSPPSVETLAWLSVQSTMPGIPGQWLCLSRKKKPKSFELRSTCSGKAEPSAEGKADPDSAPEGPLKPRKLTSGWVIWEHQGQAGFMLGLKL